MNGAPDTGLVGHGLTCVRGERTVFTDIGFAVPSGGALLLLGPNGSGKSTLLRVIAGLLKPVAGHLTWQGAAVDDPETHHSRLRYLGHLDAVKPMLSVAENLEFWMDQYGERPDSLAAVGTALDRFGIGHLANLPARFLSAGQRRRLALARIIAAPGALWLLDEPTVTLDEESVGAVEAMIAAQRAGGGVVVVATHTGIHIPGADTLRLGGDAAS
jgi:heme exporter protein A